GPGHVRGAEVAGAVVRPGRRLAGALAVPRPARAEPDGDPAPLAVAPRDHRAERAAGVGPRGGLALPDALDERIGGGVLRRAAVRVDVHQCGVQASSASARRATVAGSFPAATSASDVSSSTSRRLERTAI